MRHNRAFTLVETLIATAILALIITLFSGLILNYKKSADWFKTKTESEESLALVSKALYQDLLGASKIQITGQGLRQIVKLQTSNSIYGIQNPYVTWYVLKDDKTLARAESANDFNVPMTEADNKYAIFSDKIAINCDKFLLYQANGATFFSVDFGGDKTIKFAVFSANPQ